MRVWSLLLINEWIFKGDVNEIRTQAQSRARMLDAEGFLRSRKLECVCVCVCSMPPVYPSIYQTHVSVMSQFTCLLAAQLAALLLPLQTLKPKPKRLPRHFDRVRFLFFFLHIYEVLAVKGFWTLAPQEKKKRRKCQFFAAAKRISISWLCFGVLHVGKSLNIQYFYFLCQLTKVDAY